MATTTRQLLRSRADAHLEYLSTYLEDLPEIAAERIAGELPEREYVSLSIEWDDLMGRLKTLGGWHQSGKLSVEQEDAYLRLKGELKRSLPLIERLAFYRPPVEL